MEEWFGQMEDIMLEILRKMSSMDLVQDLILTKHYFIMDFGDMEVRLKSDFKNFFFILIDLAYFL